MANIGFDQSWPLTSGATLNSSSDTLSLISTGSGSIKASINVDLTTITDTLYLVADVYFEDIVTGAQVYNTPRFMLYKGDGTSIQNLNITLHIRWKMVHYRING